MPRRSPKAPILIVLHQEHSTPGRVGRLLRERGYPLDIRRPRFGDPLPETMAGHAGAVIFGGPMSANDPDEFVKAEIDWIAVPLKENKPYLGLCLGAQMMALHSAPTSGRIPRAAPRSAITRCSRRGGHAPERVGACPGRAMSITGTGRASTAPRRGDAGDGRRLSDPGDPGGRTAFGLQFHPEVTHAMMCRWTVMAEERLRMPGAQDRIRQLAGRFQHDPHVPHGSTGFLDHWLDEKQ